MSVDSNFFWCQLVIGFEEGEGCLVIDNSIKITDTIKQTSLVFAIAGVKNPPNTRPTETFVFRCYDPYGNEIGHSENQDPVIIQPEPGMFPSVSVLRPDPTVGATAKNELNEFKFSFLSANTMEDGE